VAHHNDMSTTARYLKSRETEDIMEIMGITQGKVKEEPPAVQKPVIEIKPIEVPISVMVDRTDRKQPVLTKDKKRKYEQMALF
jgi:hypothetical protein